MNQGRANLTGAVFALLGFALFATHDALIKDLGARYAPMQILFFTVLFGLPLAFVMLLGDPTDGNLRPRRPGWTLLRTAAVAVNATGAFFAFRSLPLAQVYAIIFAMPLLITILSIPILGERVHWQRWAAVAVGLAGVLIVLRPGQTALGLGHLAAVACALGGATVAVISRKIGNEERGVVLILYPMLLNLVLAGLFLPFVYTPMALNDLALTMVLAALAMLAMLAIIHAYRRGEAAVVAPMQYSQIIWAIAFGLLFFDETPDTITLLGTGVIIASGLYILFREAHAGRRGTRPVTLSRGRAEPGALPETDQKTERTDV